jgi:hypothetical protein
MRNILPDQGCPLVSDRAIDPIDPLDQRQRPQLTFEVPLQMGGHQAAGLAAV